MHVFEMRGRVLITSPGSLLLLLDTFLTTAGYDV